MRKILLLIVLVCVEKALQAQQHPLIYTIKADSVKITNSCDTAELIIENHTQNVSGFLYNKGKGRTEFRKAALKLNDSLYLIGADTINVAHVRANNGTSLSNAYVVLGNDSGGTAATLTSSREIPLNGHNVTFTGNGKMGIGTRNPRDLLELATPVGGDSSYANMRFTYLNEPNSYTNLIWNKFTGNQPNHYMGFSLTSGGQTVTPLKLAANSKIYLNGRVIYNGDVGINVDEVHEPRAPLDIINPSTTSDANFIVLGNLDKYHHHTIKASFYGENPHENNIKFNLWNGYDPNTQINVLTLAGDGNAIFNGNIGVQSSNPSARIQITAGSSTAGTAPIKLSAGTLLSTPENGAIEYDGSHLYTTIGSSRYQLDQQSARKSATVTGSSYTVPADIDVVFVNYTSGQATITLPTGTLDREITIKNLNTSNTIILSGLDTNESNSIATRGAITVKYTGSSWVGISKF